MRNLDLLVHNLRKLADIVLLVYDQSNPASFAEVTKLFSHLDRNYRDIPCLIVATKSDKEVLTSQTAVIKVGGKVPFIFATNLGLQELKPKDFCAEHGLLEPIQVSSKSKTGLNRLFTLAIESIIECVRTNICF